MLESRTFKRKLAKGFSYPLKTKDFEIILSRCEKPLNTLTFSDYKIRENGLLTIYYYELRYSSSYIEPGSFSIFVSAVASAERQEIREQLVSTVLPFVSRWMTAFEELDEYSTVALENQHLDMYWDNTGQNVKIVNSLES